MGNCAIILFVVKNAPVAQLDRVNGYEPLGQGFESLQARHKKERFYNVLFLCINKKDSNSEGGAQRLKKQFSGLFFSCVMRSRVLREGVRTYSWTLEGVKYICTQKNKKSMH